MSLSKERGTIPMEIFTNNRECKINTSEDIHISLMEEKDKSEILDHICKTTAIFKSQQRGDPELPEEEKRAIAHNVLIKNPSLFLTRFGQYLKKEHLKYFNNISNQDYEVSYLINKLERYLDKSSRHIDVKNRRYEALKTLIDKGEYFSETEMMRRNPLLYEQLIGQYMSEEEKKARDNIDTQNITLSNILIESIDRDNMRNLQESQEAAEDCSKEEEDTTDSSDDEESNKQCKKKKILWGEQYKDDMDKSIHNNKQSHIKEFQISNKEKGLLRQEFVTNMYQSFLDGKDIDFDYSAIDNNETYDNIDLRAQDEEEKYFDSESPETVLPEQKEDQEESEDELDLYMKSLKEQYPLPQLHKD